MLSVYDKVLCKAQMRKCLLPASYSHQQGEPVPIVEQGSKRCVRVWAHLVDENTDMGWEHAAFIQQVLARTWIGSDQLFHHLPKRDGGSIAYYLDTWLADDDALRHRV
jgi:hypothetical protein